MNQNLSSLQEIKSLLGIAPENTVQDQKLYFLLGIATNWIEEYLARPGIFVKSRTEFYSGTNSQRLLLRSRPVYTSPTIQVWVDQGAFWGSTSGAFAANTALVYGVDFSLQIDQEDGTSRSAVLYRMKDVWPKKWARSTGYLTPYIIPDTGSIKVQYVAGYTVDNLPAVLRQGVNTLVAKMNYTLPLGMELSSESYEERSVSILGERKNYLISTVAQMIWPYRNYKF